MANEELYQALKNADAAGDVEAAKKIANYIQSQPDAKESPSLGKQALTFAANKVKDYANMGFGAIRGAGSIGSTIAAPYDVAKDAINGKGLSLQSNRERRQGLDEGLQQLGADTKSGEYELGKIGAEIAGTAAVGGVLGTGAKAAGLPRLGNAIASGGFNLGGNGGVVNNAITRLVGGAINGGAQAGMIDPEYAGTGAAVGAAMPAAAIPIGMINRTIGRSFAPFTEKGKNKILADFLINKSGNNVDDVIANLENAKGATLGFNPTTGQASNSANLATLERTMKAKNPNLFQDIDQSQRTALANAVRGIGGDDLARGGLVDARTQATEQLFNQAAQKPVAITPEIEQLMQRPSMQNATSKAQRLALEAGDNFNPANMMGKDAQLIKFGLDDAINTAPTTGIGANELSKIRDTKGAYLGELEKQIPEYLQANQKFSELSKPINQMDLGNEIVNKYIPASQLDMPAPLQLNREALAKVLRNNGDSLAAKTTGFKGATLKNTLSPDQYSVIENAVKDGQFISQGDLLGKGVGSDTFQKLATNGGLEEAGMISKFTNFAPLSMTINTLKGARDLAYKGANSKLEEKLAEALLNPQQAVQLMKLRMAGGSKNAALAKALLEQAAVKSAPALAAQ